MSRLRARLAKLWPSTLASQLILVAILAVLLSNGLVVAWFTLDVDGNRETVMTEKLLDRAATTATLLAKIPPDTRQTALMAFSSNFWGDFELHHGALDLHEMDASERRLAQRLRAQLPAAMRAIPVSVRNDVTIQPPRRKPPRAPDRMGRERMGPERMGPDRISKEPPPYPRLGDRTIEVIIPLDANSHMVARFFRPARPFWQPQFLLASIITAFLVSLTAGYTAQRVARPLSKLAEAAATAARGGEAPRVPVEGPEDVRHAATAFNAMNDQVRRTLESHRQLLSAVGHDLRTPITAMRINIEFVADTELAERLTKNLDELQALTEAVLSAARDFGGGGEKMRSVDLAALIDSLCADLSDLDTPASWRGGDDTAPRKCRPNEIRRAVRNLIENAVTYGGKAEVSLERTAEGYEILVDDDGPGIPEADRARVFEPFVRLEGSRNAATGGTGLGLTLAKAIAEGHGGHIHFADRSPAGFRVRMILPYDGSV